MMKLTLDETKEWFQIRDHVKDVILHLEMCSRCWRVRDRENLIGTQSGYCCRPGDKNGCLGR